MTGDICIIGLGNVFRGDDAAGILVIRRLRGLINHDVNRVKVIEAESAGPELLDVMEKADMAILIDAAKSGQKAGTIHGLDASKNSIGLTLFPHSTHAFNLVETIELGRVLNRLPPHVLVYGIEVDMVSTSTEVSADVSQAVDRVVATIIQQLNSHSHA